MRKEVKNKAFLVVLLIGILLILSGFSASAFAQCPEHLYNWVAGLGDWSTPDNWRHEEWDPDLEQCVPVPGVPGSEDTVYVENGGTVTISSVANAKRAYIQFSSNLSLVSGLLAIADPLQLDWDGFFEQSGGTNIIQRYLYIAWDTGSNGTYELSGDGYLSAYAEEVGHGGTGTFRQAGGTNTIQHDLTIGMDAGSNGTYELGGDGELLVHGVNIGVRGAGTFRQTGGSHSAGGLRLGIEVGGDGTYKLSDSGKLNVDWTAIGCEGTGTFIQTGGTNNIEGGLTLASKAGSQGRYELHGGSIDVKKYMLRVGEEGMAYFLMNGGTMNTPWIAVGWEGTGTFIQTGGTNTIEGGLSLAVKAGSKGRYELYGGTIDVEKSSSVGEEGMASFIMDGGTINAKDEGAEIRVSSSSSLIGSGTYNIPVVYESHDCVDVTFERNCLLVGGAYNVDQCTPADFAGGTVANLLQSSVFDLSFDGEFLGKFTIAIPYDEADIADLDENNMMFHVLHETGPETYERLQDVQINRIENIVYGQSDSFGKFALSGDPFLIFNVTQPPVQNICQVAPASLTLNTIDGSVIHTWGCFSGAREVHNQEVMVNNSHFANWKNVGPIPPGVWRVGAAGSRGTHESWYPLYPVDGTETFGRDRDKFYIHGTAKIPECPNIVGQSKGCIAIMPSKFESTFVPQFENAPNVSDALNQSKLLLYVDNFPTYMYPLPDPYPYAKYELHSPANLFLQTETGHVCGYDPELGEVVNDIDGATYSGPGTDPQILTYPLFSTVPVVDHLTLIPVGAGGQYELEVSYQQLDGSVVTAQQTGQLLPGEPVDYLVTLAPDAISLFPSEPATIPATIDFDPDTLNLKSIGYWITCYIELPDGYDVDDIDVGSILLGYLLEVQHSDVQGDVLMVKFDRQDVTAYIELVLEIELPADVTLMVTGELTDGTPFEGSDTIRVIDEGGEE